MYALSEVWPTIASSKLATNVARAVDSIVAVVTPVVKAFTVFASSTVMLVSLRVIAWLDKPVIVPAVFKASIPPAFVNLFTAPVIEVTFERLSFPDVA